MLQVSICPAAVSGRSLPWYWAEVLTSGSMSLCLYGWKKNGRHQWYSDRKQTTIWEFEKTKKNTDHPTMKPIPLLAYPIRNSSMSNTLILDPFGGSGSTLIACEQTDRICYTIELDEEVCGCYRKEVHRAGRTSGWRIRGEDGKTYSFAGTGGG